jgi:hypothetical protein
LHIERPVYGQPDRSMCDGDHGWNIALRASSDMSPAITPRQITGETAMNAATHIHELSLDDMDSVSGGGGTPDVRQHCGFGQISNTVGNWQGEGGLGLGDIPAANQDHATGGGGQVNDHRTGP